MALQTVKVFIVLRHNIKLDIGFTPLLLAIKKRSNNTAKLLISELGSKAVYGFSVSGINAAHMAASTGKIVFIIIIVIKNVSECK